VVNLAKSAAAAPSPVFGATDLHFLNTLMTHIAYALDNARLLQESRLSTNRLRSAMEDLRTTQIRVVEGETLRAMGQMASGMAHHVNNLLAVISGRTQLLLARGPEPRTRRPLEIIQRATFDAAEVVRRVLGFVSIPAAPRAAPIDLSEVVRECRADAAALARRGPDALAHDRRAPGPRRHFILAKPYTTEALRSVMAGIQPRR
jgi:signal transduction histidine kinase